MGAAEGRELREHGVVLLRGFFAQAALMRLKEAARRCFERINAGDAVPEAYRFSRSSNSVILTAMRDFGCDAEDELLEPLSSPELKELICQAMRGPWRWNLEQSWVRKKWGAEHVADDRYHLQDWHQDGALGARFPLQPGPTIPMKELLTCWIPLQDCGRDSPGLEFVRVRLPGLLHFAELEDTALRRRFEADAFWAPSLDFGDGLVLLKDVLHRTHVRPGMRNDRVSVEYRAFPRESA